MSLTPASSRSRTLTRPKSSPCLTVGIPPSLPDSAIMTPSSPGKTLKRPRSQPRIRRGDVSSSATTSPNTSDDESTPKRPATAAGITPKRKVIGSIQPVSTGARNKKLQDPQYRQLSVMSPLRDLRTLKPRMQDIKDDKVMVCVRVKPSESNFAKEAYSLTSNSLALTDQHPNANSRRVGSDSHVYNFDKLISQPETTEDLYGSNIAPLIDKAMNGFNSTIFAYGQTGSGKSYTMTGNPSELGIIPCAVDGIFDAINEEPDRAYLLRVSYLEIYNESLRDLLENGMNAKPPLIYSAKGRIYVEPVVEKVVSTPHEVMDVLAQGNKRRKVGATDWNERSSRSHSVFSIIIESRPSNSRGMADVRQSTLNLIDLAGSEKAVSDAERRSEGKHINKSLLALREVINKLTDKKRPHIPYRDSKLTHLLENALGGDSNICVICTVSPERQHASETLETLKFAGRCSQVETKAKKNVLLSDDKALIFAKDKEIEELKRRLQEVANEETSEHAAELADSVAAMEARKSKLAEQLAKLNAEILTSEIRPGLPTPTPKRRRISENYRPPLHKANGRRAVSSMMKVPEEVETSSNADPFSLGRTVASLQKDLRAKEGQLARLTSELQAANDALEATQASKLLSSNEIQRLIRERDELARAKTQLENDMDLRLRDAHEKAEASRTQLLTTIEEKATRIEELEEMILKLRQSREQLVMEDQDEMEGLKAKLSEVAKENEEMRADHALHVENLNREVNERFSKMDTERKGLEMQLVTAKQSIVGLKEEVQKLDLDSQQIQQAKNDVEIRLRAQDDSVTRLTMANAALRRELDQSRNDAQAARRGHLSSSSEPQLATPEVMEVLRTQQTLRTTSTGDDGASRLRTLERDEIERLEKIVEVQKAMIDDQRDKIRYWADALEQQREMVRLLTEDDPTSSSNLKSPSNIISPGSRSTKTNLKASLPSSFTAFNLALPTTPTPLPSHPKQVSNSSARRSRRITIEHDIETLGESNKVNRARSKFDIPGEIPPSPTKVSQASSSPRKWRA